MHAELFLLSTSTFSEKLKVKTAIEQHHCYTVYNSDAWFSS